MTDMNLNATSTAPREEKARPVLWIVGLSLLAWAFVAGLFFAILKVAGA